MARKTKAEAAATREALLDAAEDMFMEHGVARTSLEQIARHAGMTRGAVYWHFKNKGDIFRAMLERVRMPFQELVDEIEALEHDVSSLEAIRLACLQGLQRFEQHPRSRRVHAILIHRCEFFSDIDPIAMQQEITDECRDSLYQHLLISKQQHMLADNLSPEVATDLLQAMLSGLFHEWIRDPGRFSIYNRGVPLVNQLIGMMHRQGDPTRKH
ncbi:TetR family transcriptional regulator [Vreelandella arcis]|uniref:Transcriptional regulator, TetR family n=1 Tax=Vreelandella arcis TaxID=416873 RepID=A0A1H0HHW8_9GAMM|nr:TetR family transcriptional regulator [Halomonas arcis]SDO18700.1 transcriptional regulator, TetR family [Halomonas arcis]